MNQALYAHMNNKRKKICIMQEIKKVKKKMLNTLSSITITIYTKGCTLKTTHEEIEPILFIIIDGGIMVNCND
jgi:hypothetical protein